MNPNPRELPESGSLIIYKTQNQISIEKTTISIGF